MRGQPRCEGCSALLIWQVDCPGCGIVQPPTPHCVACAEPLREVIRAATAQAEEVHVTIPVRPSAPSLAPEPVDVATILPAPVTEEPPIEAIPSLPSEPPAPSVPSELTQITTRVSPLRDQVLPDRRIATVLFADIEGFTAMSETMEPDLVAELMNRCFAGLTQAVLRHGGTVDKYMGDAIMAVFGAPVGHLDDPDRAVAAAIEMQDWMPEFSKRSQASGGPALGLRVGVHTGEVLAGQIGAAGHEAYTVIGDTVNVASRIEAAAEVGTVLVSSGTYRRLRRSYESEIQEPLVVKGQSKPVEVHRIRGVRRHQRSLGRAVTVGFEAVLAQLEEAVELVLNGQGDRLLEIRADPGMGTWNMVEATRDFIHEAGGRSFVLSSRSENRLQSMGPFKALIQSFAGLDSEAPPGQQRDQLVDWLETNLMVGSDGRAYLKALGAAGIRFWEAVLFADSQGVEEPLRQGARAIAWAQLKRYLQREVSSAPILLVFERIEDFDSASLDFVSELARDSDLGQLILLATTRRPVKSWNADEPKRRVVYPPRLNHEQARRWMASYLGLSEVPQEDWVNDVVRAAGGGSGRLARICDELVRSGMLRIDGGRAEIAGEFDRSAELQSSLRELVQVRIDRLPEEALKILRAASILRSAVPQEIFGKILPEFNLEEMQMGIARLTAEGLLAIERGTGQLRVPAPRIGEAVRNSIPARVRTAYAEIGYEQMVASLSQDQIIPVVMGELAIDAGREADASTWFRKAAERARSTLALRESSDLYHRVMGIAADEATRTEMMGRLGWLAFELGDYEIARSRAVASLELLTEPAEKIDMHLLSARCDLALNQLAKAQASLQGAQSLLRDDGSMEVERVRIASLNGQVHHMAGNLDRALAVMEPALETARSLEDSAANRALVADILNVCMVVHQKKGNLESSLKATQEAFDRVRQDGDPILLGRLHQAAATVHEAMGELTKAREETQAAIACAEQVHNSAALAARFINLCSYQMRLGETEEARQSLREADHHFQTSEARWLAIPLYITRLHVAVRVDDLALLETTLSNLPAVLDRIASPGMRSRAVNELKELAKLASAGGRTQAGVGDLLRVARAYEEED